VPGGMTALGFAFVLFLFGYAYTVLNEIENLGIDRNIILKWTFRK
jgi:hypothetical protein